MAHPRSEPGVHDAARIAAVRALEVLDSEPEPVFDDMARLAAAVCHTPIAQVNFLDGTRQFTKAMVRGRSTQPFPDLPLELAVCSHTINLGTDLVVPDLQADAEFATLPYVRGEPFARFYAGVPIRTEEGFAVGTVCVVDLHARSIDEDQLDALRAIARHATLLLEARRESMARARMEALVRKSSDIVAVLNRDGWLSYVSPAVTRVLGREQESLIGTNAFDLIHPDDAVAAVEGLSRTVAGPPVLIRLSHADGRWIYAEAATETLVPDPVAGGIVVNVRDISDRRKVEEALRSERRFLRAILHELEDGISAYLPDGRLRMINRAAREFFGMADRDLPPEEWASQYTLYEADGVTPMPDEDTPVQRALRGERVRPREMVVVPRNGPRRVLLISGQPIFDPDGTFVGAVAAMHDITRSREAEARLQHQALHDPLTGLPNRVLLLDRLGQAIAHSGRRPGLVAVLFLDLDRFKVVNDSLGHSTGDQLLQEVAERLHEAVRDGDTVARLGGDEFVVLCETVTDRNEAEAIAERIGDALVKPFVLDGHEVRATASIGIALSSPAMDLAKGVGPASEVLLRDADAAMYRAKDRGRARYEVFDEATRLSALHRLQAEQRLRRAIEHEWLRVLYQPIVHVDTGVLVGVEALVRYEDPDRGMVNPEEFLAVAEDTGLITQLDSWVLEQACRDGRRWQDAFPDRWVRVSANVSARQLAIPGFAELIAGVLGRSGLRATNLALEITETSLAEATAATIRDMQQLKTLGVHMGVDDFGTGYSSLAHLKRFPVDFLKIDRSFVDGLGVDREDTTIVQAVISLGHALGLTIVAEGAETPEHLALLSQLGCDLYQGYWYSKPIDAAGIETLLSRVKLPSSPVDLH